MFNLPAYLFDEFWEERGGVITMRVRMGVGRCRWKERNGLPRRQIISDSRQLMIPGMAASGHAGEGVDLQK